MVNDGKGRVNVLELHEEGRSRLESDEGLKYMKFPLSLCFTTDPMCALVVFPRSASISLTKSDPAVPTRVAEFN
jgi:hypothetical protein